MKTFISNLIRLSFKTLEKLAPSLSSRLALWLFFRPFSQKRPARELQAFENAKIRRNALRGFYPRESSQKFYQAYEWGEGEPVLLVHGWGGRATQFYSLVEELNKAGYRAVSFDAPAHGDSPGSRTNLLEYGEIIRDLSEQYGEFSAVVAHSFGAVAAIRALALDGVQSPALVTLGAPARLESILQGFRQQLQLSEASLTAIRSSLDHLSDGRPEIFSPLTHLPALKQELLVIHDTEDKSVDFPEAELWSGHKAGSSLFKTQGLGHNRVLADPVVIGEILGFLEVSSRK